MVLRNLFLHYETMLIDWANRCPSSSLVQASFGNTKSCLWINETMQLRRLLTVQTWCKTCSRTWRSTCWCSTQLLRSACSWQSRDCRYILKKPKCFRRLSIFWPNRFDSRCWLRRCKCRSRRHGCRRSPRCFGHSRSGKKQKLFMISFMNQCHLV